LLGVVEGEMTREEIQGALGINNRKYFRESFLKQALARDLIEMTMPDKPSSKYQKYRLTPTGIEVKKSLS
jgi:hypothetical protein